MDTVSLVRACGDVFRGSGSDPVIIYHEKPVLCEYELTSLYARVGVFPTITLFVVFI